MKNAQTDNILHMGIRKPEQNLEHNWQTIKIEDFVPSQKNKMCFVFGGNTTNCEEAANGNAKVVERLLPVRNRNAIDVYSFVYDKEPLTSSGLMLEEYENEINQLFLTVFKPLFLDYVSNIKEKQGVEKVLKNMIFVSHCAGSDFVDYIINDIYNLLLEKYHPSIADQLISKLQHFSYAPYHIPTKNVSNFIIAPYHDINASWAKVLNRVCDEKTQVEFPKNSVKDLLKAKENGTISYTFDKIFKKQRIISFRSEHSIYIIPNRINSNHSVGDHSIDCLTKGFILNQDSDCSNTAKLLNSSAKHALNEFVNNSSFNHKDLHCIITCETKANPPETNSSCSDLTNLCC